MQKLQLFIIILVVVALFAGGDYAINSPKGEATTLPETSSETIEGDQNITQLLLSSDRAKFPYRIDSRSRTKEIFDKFDLSSVADIRIYKNTLSSVDTSAPITSAMTVYEIQGPKNQGKLSYLSIKLKLIDQKELTTNINEDGNYGYNSFFYNDINNPSTGYLFTQIKDTLFGFQFAKDDSTNIVKIKEMIDSLMILL